jgi:hypothetical protein
MEKKNSRRFSIIADWLRVHVSLGEALGQGEVQ